MVSINVRLKCRTNKEKKHRISRNNGFHLEKKTSKTSTTYMRLKTWHKFKSSILFTLNK